MNDEIGVPVGTEDGTPVTFKIETENGSFLMENAKFERKGKGLIAHEEELYELLAWSALVKCAGACVEHDDVPWHLGDGLRMAGTRVMEIAEGMMDDE